jgi:predicted membrane-bound spermidine synthase
VFRIRLLSSVFLLSGAVSLIYQIVWQRLLTVYYGVGPVSVTLIVTVYMLGLGLGALLGGRLAAGLKQRLIFYLSIELALGLFGIASLHLLAFIGRMTAGSDYSVALVFMFLFLCVPTLLMGMTLPVLVQIFSGLIHDFQRTVCFLYFINTLGAAAGAIVASYGLVSFVGLDGAVYVAAALNIVLAVLIFIASRVGISNAESLGERNLIVHAVEETLGRFAFAAVFVTGFLALAYEIIWVRMVGVLIKDSAYAFSSILSVYLTGVAVGSYGMDRFLRAHPDASRRDIFFIMQTAIGMYVLITVCLFTPLVRWTPLGLLVKASFLVDIHPTLPSLAAGWRSNLLSLWSCADVFIWPAVFCLVPTVLMGATFPLLSVLSGQSEGREGQIVGSLYFWNILGNAAGGFATGFGLLPVLGTERTILLLGVIDFVFLLAARRVLRRALSLQGRLVAVGMACGIAVVFVPGKGDLHKAMHFPPGPDYQSYLAEGIEGVVLTYVNGENVRMYIGGSAHGGRPGYGFYYEAIEALSFAKNPRRILVVGYGTGSIVEIALRVPGVERVTLVELNRTVMRNLSRIPIFQRLLDDSRLETIVEDGRRYLLRTDEQFDAVLIDPVRTGTAYSGNLYSMEFLALVRDHLRPDGVFLLWLDEHRVLPATLESVFPHSLEYTFFALGFRGTIGPRNEERRRAILETFPASARRQIEAVEDGNQGKEPFRSRTTARTPVNTDLEPITEYYLGLPLRGLVAKRPD